MNIIEHTIVVLTRDLTEYRLHAGDVGTVVHIYPDAKAYEVEFATGAGDTLAVETLEPDDIRPLAANEILHTRPVTAV